MRTASPFFLVLALAACADDPLAVRAPEPVEPLAALSCQASVRSGGIRCGDSPGATGASRSIIGGQGVNLRLTSSNARYDPATAVFSADVTVQNLLPEAIGTADWITLTGVRIFFHAGPTVSSGAGTVEVGNADGMGAFTGSGQPYFEYLEALPPNAVSTPRRWEFAVGPGVETFTFLLFVAAPQDGDDRGTGRYASVATGGQHACALRPGGDAYCWDSGMLGQLGNGEFAVHERPVRVAGGGAWRTISTGHWSTCALRQDGTPYCWGNFSVPESLQEDPLDCELGNLCRPGQLRGDHRFQLITAGLHHGCGLTSNGEAWCWGLATVGALGSSAASDTCDVGGPVRCAILPVPVDGDHRFNDIAGGEQHTCGLEKGGVAYCWGFNGYGQRGDGTTVTSTGPTAVQGNLRFSQLDTYYATTCGLTTDGQAWCWGDNWHGQLGNGTTGTRSLVPVQVQQGNLRFHRLAVGFEHVCALAQTGEAWCWGGNTFGQLGDGTGGDVNLSNVPVAVAGGRRFRDLDSGHLFSCAITRTDGEAWCWGHTMTGEGTPGVSRSYRCHYERCALEPWMVLPPDE